MTETIVDNTGRNRFELDIDGQVAYADYHVTDETLYIDYVEAPVGLRGTGAAGRLMEGIMTAAAGKGYAIVPVCGYAAAWMRRHRKL